MRTTQTLNADVALGLVPDSNPSSPARSARAAESSPIRRRALAWGSLAAAGGAAVALWFKAAVIFNEVLASLNTAYQAFYT